MRVDDYCSLSNGGLVLNQGLQRFTRQNILTDHPLMTQQLDMLDRAGVTALPLTILGEKGSGKDMIAQYAHLASSRSNAPLLKINCAYLTEEQISLELFGTGNSRADVLLKRAAGGSLYIENADLLPYQTQYQLTNHIADQEGADQNIRYIACLQHATFADCDPPLIEPFVFQFSAMTFVIPPLRDRPQDILLLCLQQLNRIREEYRLERLFSPAVMAAMLSYEWPGNIRQLLNVVDRMAFFCDTTLIDSVSLFRNSLSASQPFGAAKPAAAPPPKAKSLKELTLEYEVKVINQYMEAYGSLRKAAAALKVSPSVLSSKLTKYHTSSTPKK